MPLVFVANTISSLRNLFKQDDKLFISNISKISSYSDTPAVKIAIRYIRWADDRTNLIRLRKAELYLYKSYFSSLAAPAAELDFYSIAVVNDKIIYKGEKNKRILNRPNGGVGGFLCRSEANVAENLNPGDKISIILMKTRNMPEMYLEKSGTV
jgi:hypothetical protein